MVEHTKFNRFNPSQYPHFYARVFTEREQTYSQQKIHRYAGIFAAKEAVYKATATYGATYLSQFEIDHTLSGRPLIRDLYNTDQADNFVKINNKLIEVKVSISHTQQNSIAFAMARLEEDYNG